jgi:hypothetical protein
MREYRGTRARQPGPGPATRRSTRQPAGEPKLNNWELAVYALYLAGGLSKPVHTEDVALKCFELAPDAFSWVRHPRIPDKDIVRVALTDARKTKAGGLVSGRSGRAPRRGPSSMRPSLSDGWMLTNTGAAWIAGNEPRLSNMVGSRELRHDRQDLLQRLSRVRNHPLFERFKKDTTFSPTLGEMAELFRCRPDAPFSIWQKRIQATRNDASVAEQTDTLEFLDRCLATIESTIR